eukprot:9593475-Lingulodinium_polyedra.AAC.1
MGERWATTDPLAVPNFRGKRRARRINKALKTEVAKEGSKRGAFKTGRDGLRALARLNRCLGRPPPPVPRNLERWEAGALIGHLQSTRATFREPGRWCVSLAMDATRLGKADILMP